MAEWGYTTIRLLTFIFPYCNSYLLILSWRKGDTSSSVFFSVEKCIYNFSVFSSNSNQSPTHGDCLEHNTANWKSKGQLSDSPRELVKKSLPHFKLVQPLWQTVWKIFKKLKINLSCDPAIPFLGSCPNNSASYFRYLLTMFTVVLVIIAWKCKQHKWPVSDKRTVKMCSMDTRNTVQL